MTFDGKVALVTGGLGGIGIAVVQTFLDRGATVVVADRSGSDDSLAQFASDKVSFVHLDVTSEPNWEAVVDGVVAAHGKLDVLINIAGIFKPGIPFEDMALATWREHFDVNLDGSFLGCKFAIRAMAKTGGGAIVNFSSGLAHIMLADGAAYCVSKAAVLALTRVAAKAGAKHGVRVNAVLPGAIETPMLWGNLRDGLDAETLMGMLIKQHPIGRIGQPIDIAQAVTFLCAPENSFVTGALLAVDGGQLVA